MLLTEYRIENNKPVIFSYGRNKDGVKYCNKIRDFKPYFYVLKGEEYIYKNDRRVSDIIDEGFKEIKGKEVVKIVVNNPYDIRELKNLVVDSFEGDIDLNIRYSIDTIGEIEKEPIATCFIDIETDHGVGFPSPRKAEYPITAITCYNTLIGKMITFAWRKDMKKSVDVIKDDTTMIFDNEREMLNTFLTYIEDTNPDIFSAWNVSFDMGYIVQRLYNTAMNYNRLSPMGVVTKEPDKYYKDQDNVNIKGRIIFDLLTAYKKMNFKGLPSYKLDNVAEKELGEKKVEYEGTLANLWRTQFDKFIEYNKKDVELLIRIDKKKKIIESFDEIRRMSKCRFDDLFESTKVTDAFILTYCKDKNIILPSKSFHSKEKFAGATVLNPIKGLHEYVSVVDFSALYPSIIRSINCSPETLSSIETDTTVNLNIPYLDSNDMEEKLSVKSHRSKLNKEFGEFFVENWNIEEQKFNCNVPDKYLPFLHYKKIHYSQEQNGLLPEVMNYLIKYRKTIKNKRDEHKYGTELYDFYERKQYATKVMTNCFHPNTNIMTKNGIKNIKDVKIGDIVYSINPKTLQIEYKPVTALCKEYFNGELSVYENQSFKVRTTPNHKFLIKDRNNEIKKIEAKDLMTSQVIPIHQKMDFSNQQKHIYLHELLEFENPKLYIKHSKDLRSVKYEFRQNNINLDIIKRNKHFIKDYSFAEVINWTKIDIKNAEKLGYEFYWKDGYRNSIILPYKIKNYDFAKIIGWYLSEGNLYKGTPKQYKNGNSRGVSYKINISQEKYQEEMINDVSKLIHRFYRNHKGISICSKALFEFLEQFGRGSYNLVIPQKYMDMLDNQGLFDGMFLGDGKQKDKIYVSVSKQLAENFLHLLYKLGYKGNIKKRNNENIYDTKFFSQPSNWTIKKRYLSKEKYSGDVYNLTVADNHTVLVGEKSGFLWCGQSFYGCVGYSGFRLYTPEIAASITYIGRNSILWSKRLIEKKGYDVVFSDTDSLGLKVGNKDNFIENSEKLQLYLNSTYDEFTSYFNIKKHYLSLEFEKTFEKVLFGDAKKRYAGKICYYKGKQVQDMLIMGFELVRSDCSAIAKETQKKFFDMMFLEDKDRKYLTAWLRDRIKTLRADGYSYSQLGIPTPLNKPINEYTTNLPIVRGVEYSNNDLKLDIRPGEKVKLIYVRGMSTDVIAFREEKELPKNINIDYEKHIDESIRKKCERIFDALGWSMNELEFSGSLLDF